MIDESFSFILAYPASVVSHILGRFQPKSGSLILDPFCGTGTTLVECKRRRLESVGIEANPVCDLAARVKTSWDIDGEDAQLSLVRVVTEAKRTYRQITRRYGHANRFFGAPEVRSLVGYESIMNSGILDRGWMSRRPALMALSLADSIQDVSDVHLREILLVALLGSLVSEFSNVKYGPELYKFKRDLRRLDGFETYLSRTEKLFESVEEHSTLYGNTAATVIHGNSMALDPYAQMSRKADFVITSPPYPAEHDYTRMTRLELAFGGFLPDSDRLRTIKKTMVPCSSKSSYVDQQFYKKVSRFKAVKEVRNKIYKKSLRKSHGFARVYPRLVGDYFGGMFMHLKAMQGSLNPGAKCAYVIGDQSSFFGVRIETASILSEMLSSKQLKYKVLGLETWRVRRATTGRGRKLVPERILYFERV